MNQKLLIVAAGTVARLVGQLVSLYGEWLAHRIVEYAEQGYHLFEDLNEFVHWLLEMIAGQISGRRMQQSEQQLY